MTEAPTQTTHGRVRAVGKGPDELPEFIGVTLSGSEHLLPVKDALGLANAIILTTVDSEARQMQERSDDA